MAGTAPTCVLIFGGLLRLDALTIATASTRRRGLPRCRRDRGSRRRHSTDWMVWYPSRSIHTPTACRRTTAAIIYLDIGRTMTAFYEPVSRAGVSICDKVFLCVQQPGRRRQLRVGGFLARPIWLTYLGAALWSRRSAAGRARSGDGLRRHFALDLGWRDDAYGHGGAARISWCGAGAPVRSQVRSVGSAGFRGRCMETVQLGAAGTSRSRASGGAIPGGRRVYSRRASRRSGAARRWSDSPPWSPPSSPVRISSTAGRYRNPLYVQRARHQHLGGLGE